MFASFQTSKVAI